MKRLLNYLVALLLVLPGIAAAQDKSPIPDHWLTLDSLAAALGLSDPQGTQVRDTYESVNRVLQDATQRRAEIKASFQGTRPVSQMSEDERKALTGRLDAVRVEYEGRQAELERQLTALRALLSPGAQTLFDALPKPRLVPATTTTAPAKR